MRTAIRKIKLWIKILIGREFLSKVDIELQTQRFGSDYGGWEVFSEVLCKDSIVYSFGVGEDITFDLELIGDYGLTVHAFDPTPRSIAWVKSRQLPSNFHMHEYGIADRNGLLSFYPPTNPKYVSHSAVNQEYRNADPIQVAVQKLSTIMDSLEQKQIDVLKLDIEGSEYGVISALVSSDIRPSQVLVEFHHRFPNIGIEMSKTAIGQLRSAGYLLFNTSDSHEEFSFVHQSIL